MGTDIRSRHSKAKQISGKTLFQMRWFYDRPEWRSYLMNECRMTEKETVAFLGDLRKETCRFIYPPRPEASMPLRESIEFYLKQGWYAQLKYNDTRICVDCLSGYLRVYNRRGEEVRLKQSYLEDELLAVADKFPIGRLYLDGGYLNDKHAAIKGMIVLWDVLIVGGQYLTGTTYAERYARLCDIVPAPCIPFVFKKFGFGVRVTEHIFVPVCLVNEFQCENHLRVIETVNSQFENPLLEGLVWKHPGGKLRRAFGESNNSDWVARARVQTGRHRF